MIQRTDTIINIYFFTATDANTLDFFSPPRLLRSNTSISPRVGSTIDKNPSARTCIFEADNVDRDAKVLVDFGETFSFFFLGKKTTQKIRGLIRIHIHTHTHALLFGIFFWTSVQHEFIVISNNKKIK